MSNYRKAVTWMLAIVFLASGGAKLVLASVLTAAAAWLAWTGRRDIRIDG